MSEWQEKMKSVIDSIPFTPFGRGASAADGVTEDIYWGDDLLYRAASPPKSYCVGAVTEAFLKTLKHFKTPDDITKQQLIELRRWAFVYGEEYRKGIAGGLVELGWADWVKDPYDAQYGDLAQINGVRFDSRGANGIPYWDDGHCVIITGVEKKKGIDALTDWSSTPAGKRGHMHSWHAINKSRKGISRYWNIARMKTSFLGEAMSDSDQMFVWGMLGLGATALTAGSYFFYKRWKEKGALT
jgi:hypothetical protein